MPIKKVILYVFLFAAVYPMSVNSQSPINLSFKALEADSNTAVTLDSVYIINLTQNCDTTLYKPVSKLTINAGWPVGINKSLNEFVLNQNFPNPFIGSTTVTVYRDYSGPLNIFLLDCFGKKLAEYHDEFEEGLNSFTISSSGNRVLILEVFDNKNKQAIKLICNGQNHASNTIQYEKHIDYKKNTPKNAVVSNFNLILGDQISFTAYANGYLRQTLMDKPFRDTKYIFEMAIDSMNYFYPWMAKPYFALPARGIDLVVGTSVTIYGDNLINVPIENNLKVIYTCDIGTQTGNNLTLNPTPEQIGEHTLTITFKNGNRLITEIETKLSVSPLAVTGDSKVMLCGNSLVWAGAIPMGNSINTILTPTITFLGSQGTTVKNEGVPGASYYSIIRYPGSETYPNHFFLNGAFSIPAYFEHYAIDKPDYVFIRFGVNDMLGQCSGDFTDEELDAIINDSKSLINAFSAINDNLNIMIGLGAICASTRAGWNASYDESVKNQEKYIEYVHKLSSGILATYDNFAYSKRVKVSNEVIFLDRNDGYSKISGIHTTEVHPNIAGYKQIGNGIALNLNRELIKPTPLKVVSEKDNLKIDFTDHTGGIAENEIYESKNGEAYTLISTLAAGVTYYQDSTKRNGNIYFKIRSKIGLWYSDFSKDAILKIQQ